MMPPPNRPPENPGGPPPRGFSLLLRFYISLVISGVKDYSRKYFRLNRLAPVCAIFCRVGVHKPRAGRPCHARHKGATEYCAGFNRKADKSGFRSVSLLRL